MAKGGKGKNKKTEAVLVPDAAFDQERISIPFDLEEVGKYKIGQEVAITIKGCITRLEGEEFYSNIGLEIYDKTIRKTSNVQAAGIKDLADADEEYD